MSLVNALKKKCKVEFFTTPSHAQRFFIFPKFKQFYKYDISETEAYNPQEALRLAEEKAAKIYNTKSTHFLTNGSTSGIIAAVLSCIKQGEKVLIWDKAHPCHKNAVKLAGATPIFYELEKDKNWGIYSATPPEIIEYQFKKDKIRAVIITSPTYEGIVSDIAKIKEICKKYRAYLIVDEAHGALYPFCDKLPTSAIYGTPHPNRSLSKKDTQSSAESQGERKNNYSCNPDGADFVIQSLHKTAGGLNPTALLHCNFESRHCETVSTEANKECPPKQSSCNIDIKQTLELISTTSPSYPLLASIEKNINYLNSKKGRKKILELIENIENLKKSIHNCEFQKSNDPTKILVKIDKLSGFKLSEILFKKYKIEDERANEKSVMLLCGIGTDIKRLNRLEKILKGI